MTDGALTITEGLAEIKTIGKRIAKKREFIFGFLFRQETMKDPLANEGGSKAAIQRERQAVADLETRIVAIRAAIQKANTETQITVEGDTRSIQDWLVWRREVAPNLQSFVQNALQRCASIRQQAAQKSVPVRTDSTTEVVNDVTVNIDEQALSQESEKLVAILGTLDGQLSLKNATTVIGL
jgi:hypothetical protein